MVRGFVGVARPRMARFDFTIYVQAEDPGRR
jgi:hypothetical protein